jgi:hypothetical protein
MTTNSGQVLSLLLKELTGVHVAANKLTSGLGGIRTAALAAGEAFVGWEIGKTIWHAIEANRELNKELERTKQLGGDFAAHLDKTRAAAFQTTYDAPTSVVSDNVRLARELGTTIGKPEAASAMLTDASKAAYVIANYTHENPEEIIKNLVRTADARAQIYSVGADGKEHVDQSKLLAELNAAAKGLILGGGFIHSNDLLQFARQSSAVAKSQTPEAFYANGVEAAIAMGAAKLGTAETSLMQQFIGGTMTAKVANHLTEGGLLHSNEWHSDHGHVVMKPSVAKRFEPMMQDPIAWLSTGEGGQAVKAYATKEGISVIAAVMQLFGRQTTQRLASEAMSNAPQFARAREIYGNIPSVQAQYAELHNNDLGTNLTEVAAAWKSFMEAFSDAGVPLVIPILHGLTDVIQGLESVTANHPTIVRDLTGVAGGIAGILVLDGSMKLFNVVAGPFAGALGQITGVSGLAATAGGIAGIAKALTGLGAVAGVSFGVKSGLDSATAGIFDKIHGDGEWKRVHDDMDKGNPFTNGTFFGSSAEAKPASSPYIAPASQPAQLGANGPIAVRVVNGRDIASGVSNYQADQLSRAPSSGTGPDLRQTPWMPGLNGYGY